MYARKLLAASSRLQVVLLCCLIRPGLGAVFYSGSIVGAVLGTFFSTLAAVAVVGLIIYFCCYKQRSPQVETQRKAEDVEAAAVKYEVAPKTSDFSGYVACKDTQYQPKTDSQSTNLSTTATVPTVVIDGQSRNGVGLPKTDLPDVVTYKNEDGVGPRLEVTKNAVGDVVLTAVQKTASLPDSKLSEGDIISDIILPTKSMNMDDVNAILDLPYPVKLNVVKKSPVLQVHEPEIHVPFSTISLKDTEKLQQAEINLDTKIPAIQDATGDFSTTDEKAHADLDFPYLSPKFVVDQEPIEVQNLSKGADVKCDVDAGVKRKDTYSVDKSNIDAGYNTIGLEPVTSADVHHDVSVDIPGEMVEIRSAKLNPKLHTDAGYGSLSLEQVADVNLSDRIGQGDVSLEAPSSVTKKDGTSRFGRYFDYDMDLTNQSESAMNLDIPGLNVNAEDVDLHSPHVAVGDIDGSSKNIDLSLDSTTINLNRNDILPVSKNVTISGDLDGESESYNTKLKLQPGLSGTVNDNLNLNNSIDISSPRYDEDINFKMDNSAEGSANLPQNVELPSLLTSGSIDTKEMSSDVEFPAWAPADIFGDWNLPNVEGGLQDTAVSSFFKAEPPTVNTEENAKLPKLMPLKRLGLGKVDLENDTFDVPSPNIDANIKLDVDDEAEECLNFDNNAIISNSDIDFTTSTNGAPEYKTSFPADKLSFDTTVTDPLHDNDGIIIDGKLPEVSSEVSGVTQSDVSSPLNTADINIDDKPELKLNGPKINLDKEIEGNSEIDFSQPTLNLNKEIELQELRSRGREPIVSVDGTNPSFKIKDEAVLKASLPSPIIPSAGVVSMDVNPPNYSEDKRHSTGQIDASVAMTNNRPRSASEISSRDIKQSTVDHSVPSAEAKSTKTGGIGAKLKGFFGAGKKSKEDKRRKSSSETEGVTMKIPNEAVTESEIESKPFMDPYLPDPSINVTSNKTSVQIEPGISAAGTDLKVKTAAETSPLNVNLSDTKGIKITPVLGQLHSNIEMPNVSEPKHDAELNVDANTNKISTQSGDVQLHYNADIENIVPLPEMIDHSKAADPMVTPLAADDIQRELDKKDIKLQSPVESDEYYSSVKGHSRKPGITDHDLAIGDLDTEKPDTSMHLSQERDLPSGDISLKTNLSEGKEFEGKDAGISFDLNRAGIASNAMDINLNQTESSFQPSNDDLLVTSAKVTPNLKLSVPQKLSTSVKESFTENKDASPGISRSLDFDGNLSKPSVESSTVPLPDVADVSITNTQEFEEPNIHIIDEFPSPDASKDFSGSSSASIHPHRVSFSETEPLSVNIKTDPPSTKQPTVKSTSEVEVKASPKKKSLFPFNFGKKNKLQKTADGKVSLNVDHQEYKLSPPNSPDNAEGLDHLRYVENQQINFKAQSEPSATANISTGYQFNSNASSTMSSSSVSTEPKVMASHNVSPEVQAEIDRIDNRLKTSISSNEEGTLSIGLTDSDLNKGSSDFNVSHISPNEGSIAHSPVFSVSSDKQNVQTEIERIDRRYGSVELPSLKLNKEFEMKHPQFHNSTNHEIAVDLPDELLNVKEAGGRVLVHQEASLNEPNLESSSTSTKGINDYSLKPIDFIQPLPDYYATADVEDVKDSSAVAAKADISVEDHGKSSKAAEISIFSDAAIDFPELLELKQGMKLSDSEVQNNSVESDDSELDDEVELSYGWVDRTESKTGSPEISASKENMIIGPAGPDYEVTDINEMENATELPISKENNDDQLGSAEFELIPATQQDYHISSIEASHDENEIPIQHGISSTVSVHSDRIKIEEKQTEAVIIATHDDGTGKATKAPKKGFASKMKNFFHSKDDKKGKKDGNSSTPTSPTTDKATLVLIQPNVLTKTELDDSRDNKQENSTPVHVDSPTLETATKPPVVPEQVIDLHINSETNNSVDLTSSNVETQYALRSSEATNSEFENLLAAKENDLDISYSTDSSSRDRVQQLDIDLSTGKVNIPSLHPELNVTKQTEIVVSRGRAENPDDFFKPTQSVEVSNVQTDGQQSRHEGVPTIAAENFGSTTNWLDNHQRVVQIDNYTTSVHQLPARETKLRMNISEADLAAVTVDEALFLDRPHLDTDLSWPELVVSGQTEISKPVPAISFHSRTTKNAQQAKASLDNGDENENAYSDESDNEPQHFSLAMNDNRDDIVHYGTVTSHLGEPSSSESFLKISTTSRSVTEVTDDDTRSTEAVQSNEVESGREVPERRTSEDVQQFFFKMDGQADVASSTLEKNKNDIDLTFRRHMNAGHTPFTFGQRSSQENDFSFRSPTSPQKSESVSQKSINQKHSGGMSPSNNITSVSDVSSSHYEYSTPSSFSQSFSTPATYSTSDYLTAGSSSNNRDHYTSLDMTRLTLEPLDISRFSLEPIDLPPNDDSFYHDNIEDHQTSTLKMTLGKSVNTSEKEPKKNTIKLIRSSEVTTKDKLLNVDGDSNNNVHLGYK